MGCDSFRRARGYPRPRFLNPRLGPDLGPVFEGPLGPPLEALRGPPEKPLLGPAFAPRLGPPLKARLGAPLVPDPRGVVRSSARSEDLLRNVFLAVVLAGERELRRSLGDREREFPLARLPATLLRVE